MTHLMHAGLTVCKSDIQNFYIDILGFELEKNFQLNAGLTESIFHIKDSPEVYHIYKDEVALELFVIPKFMQNNFFQHLCLKMDNCEAIYEKALENNYWVLRRTNSQNKTTYFLRDNMNNLFELKDN